MRRLWNTLRSVAGKTCLRESPSATRFPGIVPATALASFPRSGSSYTRSLVERATGELIHLLVAASWL